MTQPDEYTAENICGALGIGGFDNLPPANAVRILFLPSFHPEVCITIHASGSESTVHLIGFVKESLWGSGGSGKLQIHERSVAITFTDFTQYWAVIQKLTEINFEDRGFACLDGMQTSCLLIIDGRKKIVKGNVGVEEVTNKVSKATVRLAWQYLHDELSCEMLRNIAFYLDEILPDKEILASGPTKQTLKIVVLDSSNEAQ
ncbi:MAG TPA: hypothetical protein VEK08_07540 [Planctomycetota bacterium]|nr:hypothetical protein [Planctomycetota bacterium]